MNILFNINWIKVSARYVFVSESENVNCVMPFNTLVEQHASHKREVSLNQTQNMNTKWREMKSI